MNPGRYKHQIKFYRPTKKLGAYGVEKPTTFDGTRRCYIVPKKNEEKNIADGQLVAITYEIYMRLDKCITTSHLIEWEDQTLKIKTILPFDLKREMVLTCVEHPTQRASK